MTTVAPTLGLPSATQHICRAGHHQVYAVEGLSKEGGPPMTEHAKDILAGLLLAGLIMGMLLGGWVALRLLVY
jgi:hypothetical protein